MTRFLPLLLLLGCASNPRPAMSGEAYYGRALDILEKNRIDAKENIKVTPLHANDDHTVSLVQVNFRVRPHFHADHDEVVYALEGAGTFFMAGKAFDLKPGDVMVIPRGTVHSFTNEPPGAAAVLSIFSPKFDPTDRHFVDE